MIFDFWKMSHLIGITDMPSMTFQVGTILLENLEAILAITFCNGFHYCHYFNNTFIIAVEKFNGIQLLDPLYKTYFFSLKFLLFFQEF